MKREWFEPGPDGESPFVRKYNASPGTAGEAVAAAFRALLAGEEQSVDTQRSIAAALANGQLSLQDEITRLRAELARLKNECSDQQSYVLDLESAIARKDTRIKVLEVANDSLTQYSSNLTAERDALQARIDAGVRMWWGSGSVFGGESSRDSSDTHTALLIDARPIDQPDHIADPGKMVDERTGPADRRQSEENLLGLGRRVFQKRGFKQQGATYRERQQCNDRRRTAGTIADRKGKS